MLTILFISVFEYTYFCFNSVFFLIFTTFTPLAIFSYISFGLYKFLALVPGIGAVRFLSLEVDILKNKRFANLGNFYFYVWL